MFKPSLGLCLILFLAACVTTEETKRLQLNFISDREMSTLGEQSYAEILQTEKRILTGPDYEMVLRVGRRIAEVSAKDFAWEFNLIDQPKTANAFCLPGGKIAVYSGILPITQNEAGLAAVIGHEVAHATLRHGAERMSQGVLLKLGLSLADVKLARHKYRGLISEALGVGAQVGIMMPFSRSHETEADLLGLKYMVRAGYDPHEAILFWQRMASAGGLGTPEWLSTHPHPERRVQDMQKEIARMAN